MVHVPCCRWPNSKLSRCGLFTYVSKQTSSWKFCRSSESLLLVSLEIQKGQRQRNSYSFGMFVSIFEFSSSLCVEEWDILLNSQFQVEITNIDNLSCRVLVIDRRRPYYYNYWTTVVVFSEVSFVLGYNSISQWANITDYGSPLCLWNQYQNSFLFHEHDTFHFQRCRIYVCTSQYYDNIRNIWKTIDAPSAKFLKQILNQACL